MPAPKECTQVKQVLSSMGVTAYEPRVMNQLLEFMHRESHSVIKTASKFCVHAGKDQIDSTDISRAIKTGTLHRYKRLPSVQRMKEAAWNLNRQPLPIAIPKNSGDQLMFIPLPDPKQQMKPRHSMRVKHLPSNSLYKKPESDVNSGNDPMAVDDSGATNTSKNVARGDYNKHLAEKQISMKDTLSSWVPPKGD